MYNIVFSLHTKNHFWMSLRRYGPWFVRDYIDASHPYISIGEYWDSCKYSGFSLDYNQGHYSILKTIFELRLIT